MLIFNISNQKGFSLIEILGVMILFSIAMTIAIPNFLGLIDHFILEATHNRLFNEIRHVKMEAMRTEDLARISFPYFAPRDYYIISLPGETAVRNDLPNGIEFSTIRTGFGGYNPTIMFRPDGTPWGGAAIGITNSNGESRYVIVAAVTGRVRKSNVLPEN